MGRRLPGPAAAPARFLLPLLLGIPALVALDTLPLWDGLIVSSGIGLGWAAQAARPGTVASSAVGVVLFLTTADLLGRLLLPPPPGFHDPETLSPVLRSVHYQRSGDVVCALMAGEPGHRAALPDPDGRPLVLHLGDSMLVFGSDGPTDGGRSHPHFPQLVAQRDPGRQHVDLGVAGTSVDVQLAIARTWLDLAPVDAVVSYVFLNNDLSELGRPLPCCTRGPIDLTTDGAPSRCDAPSDLLGWTALTDLARRSEDPVAVRALTRSPTFGHARARAAWLQGPTSPLRALRDANDAEIVRDPDRLARANATVVRVLSALQDTTRAHGANLVVVVLPAAGDGPLRHEDTADMGVRSRSEALVAELNAMHIPTIDAWPFLDGPDGCPPSWFLADTYHLSDTGHARLADWISPHLFSLLGPPSP